MSNSQASEVGASLHVEHVSKTYLAHRGARLASLAVDDVSFEIAPGASVGLVGASGSGKSTLAKMIIGAERPTSGQIRYGNLAIERIRRRELRSLHRRVQMVFQDPYGALNPMHTVEYVVSRPCVNFLGMSRIAASERAHELLEAVGLVPTVQFAKKLPHQLSGGQRQRVVIARALASEPELIIADEPVSMLDVSMRAGILKLLATLREERKISLLYITHDLLSARVITDHILVLNEGQVVERGETKHVLQHPTHEYTVRLLDAVTTAALRCDRVGTDMTEGVGYSSAMTTGGEVEQMRPTTT